MVDVVAMDPDDEAIYESLHEIRSKDAYRYQHHLEANHRRCVSASFEDDDCSLQTTTKIEDLMKTDVVNDEVIQQICDQEVEEYIQQGCGDSQHDGEAPAPTRPQHPLSVSPDLLELPLEIGDHVYQWRSFAGIPHMFQHHGLVMDIKLDEQGEMELQIADFSCILREPTNDNPSANCPEITQTQSVDMLTGGGNGERRRRKFSVKPHGILRVYKSSSKDPKWHKVHYRANVWKTSLWRSGTCTCVDSDPPAKVLARAYFLLENPSVLPSYHIFRSNCECVALWCKTGSWSTLQASSLLSLTAAGQLKSTATLAAYAASSQVTVQTVTPAAGVLGWLGYTTTTATQVSLLSTQPHLVPLLAAYGVVTAGGPSFVLWKARLYWEQTTAKLEEAFWAHAMKDPDTFARSMLHWSEKHKAFER